MFGWLVLAGAGAPAVTRAARVVGFSWRRSAGRDAGGSGGCARIYARPLVWGCVGPRGELSVDLGSFWDNFGTVWK